MGCKLLILGFDGMDANLLFHPEYGMRWPHLRSIWEHGNRGECQPELAATGPSWTTIYTGQSWEKHRVHDAWAREMAGTHTVTQVPFPFMWNWLNDAGLSVGVINMPVTFPPQRVTGYMVSGFPSPQIGITYPATLQLPDGYLVDYINAIPESTRRPEVWYRQRPVNEVFAESQRIDRQKIDLLERLPILDVMMVAFMTIDHIGHHVVEQRGALDWLLEAYNWCDALTGMVLERMRPERVVLVSDHGFDVLGHTYYGVFAAKGPGLAITPMRCQNLDILPMVLEMMGLSGKLPGESRLNWTAGRPKLRPIHPDVGDQTEAYSEKERKAIESQLRALGYLD